MVCRPPSAGRTGPSRAGGARRTSSAVLADGFDFGQQEFGHRVVKAGVRPVFDWGSHSDQVVAAGKTRIGMIHVLEDRPQSALCSIPNHRISHVPWDCKREACTLRGNRTEQEPDRPSSSPLPVSSKLIERLATREPFDHADRRARPLLRRARSTARPPRVLIRDRKPCFFARLRTLG